MVAGFGAGEAAGSEQGFCKFVQLIDRAASLERGTGSCVCQG